MNRDGLPGPRWLKACWNEHRPQQLLLGTIELIWVEASLDCGPLMATDPLQAALLQIQSLPTAMPAEVLLGLPKPLLSRVPAPARRDLRRRFAFRHHQLVAWPDRGPFDWSGPRDFTRASDAHLARLQELGYAVIRQPREGCCVGWQTTRRYAVALLQVAEELRIYLDPDEARSLASPVMTLPLAEASAFPELHAPPEDASLQQVWHQWAASRSVPTELQECVRLTFQAGVLRVEPELALQQWLRDHRPDVLTAEIWLWVNHRGFALAARLQF